MGPVLFQSSSVVPVLSASAYYIVPPSTCVPVFQFQSSSFSVLVFHSVLSATFCTGYIVPLVKPLTKDHIQLTFQYCEFRAEYYRCFEGSRGWKGSGRERVYHTLNGATYYQGRCLQLCKVIISMARIYGQTSPQIEPIEAGV